MLYQEFDELRHSLTHFLSYLTKNELKFNKLSKDILIKKKIYTIASGERNIWPQVKQAIWNGQRWLLLNDGRNSFPFVSYFSEQLGIVRSSKRPNSSPLIRSFYSFCSLCLRALWTGAEDFFFFSLQRPFSSALTCARDRTLV